MTLSGTAARVLQRHVRQWKTNVSRGGGRQWGLSSTRTAAASTEATLDKNGSSSGSSSSYHCRKPIRAHPVTPRRQVPANIAAPPYAKTGMVPALEHPDSFYIHEADSANRMRDAARLARRTLDLACHVAAPGVTTDAVDAIVHEALLAAGAYPSPLNYAGFPKSLCSSVNEVICHGIPDARPLELGDVVSFDVSCFINGVHGDNCATIIVGDQAAASNSEDTDDTARETDWRGVPVKTEFDNAAQKEHFVQARKLVHATRQALYAAIDTVRPGSCLTDVGDAIETVAEQYGYESARKYRGHGISHEFHCPPFVKHYRNKDRLQLEPGMIFTIEPMLVMGRQECTEWPDEWTVVTLDGSLAAQFEHTVLVTDNGVEILTLPG